ncbi:hypothetical protein UFOVP1304_44 [uncultured Caudovirales phage]|uniref:Uncharacterized protein n=1 Tax=uncultured Caudovirales phage TaxID=2100421 RepID=A0A6J5RI57_9CAUD|nr:hypothetical protein UFOVP1304_44 [uncultured Caudovirales phage]
MARIQKQTIDANIAEYAGKRRAAHADLVRESIQTTLLVAELHKVAFDKRGAAKYTPVRMKAIEMLLDKSLPDLASIKHEVEPQNITFIIATDFQGV